MTKWQNLKLRRKTGLIILLTLLAITGLWWAHHAYATYQVTQRANHALADAGYAKYTVRRKVYREATGPFSGIAWYNYTLANAESLKASRSYAKFQGKDTRHLTLKNCPIVYRVVLTPPGTRNGKWTAEIYLDTNDALKDSSRPAFVRRLSQSSRRVLRLRQGDR
ncbi:hypothetical protein [Lacticaseibacillus parakribbianus]|uniref:hypothetical protein n=1 Tax=Lacticaseibacillus parakribbianus TaxID=2970927 RepID=UPI0021CAEA7F|nr:hypothetical protein [Lacticaseibacillus parakribbianus]